MPTAYLGRGLHGVADVGLASAISAQYLAATVNAIRTSGYATAGVGVGVYVSDSQATAGLAAAHPRFCKQSLDGRHWRLLPEPHISVTSGGALGNGSADDYAAIQAAINYGLSFASATIYFPKGTYIVSASPEIVHGKGINLLGEGPDNTIIQAGAFPAMKTKGYWRSRVTGIQFSCNANATGGAFELDGENDGSFGAQGVVFTNCMFMGNYNSRYAFTNVRVAGGYGQGSENVWIGCAFQGAGHNAGDALFAQFGQNALNNTLIGCNFQGFITGVMLYGGNADILHCGFQSTYGYEQIVKDGWDVDGSFGSVGDTFVMTGCRTESLRIYRGGGSACNISAFGHVPAGYGSWAASGSFALNDLIQGLTAAGNHKLYRCTTAGASGGTVPVWPESGTVSDGTVTWTQLDFNVFDTLAGSLRGGQIQFGQIHVLQVNGIASRIDDIRVDRDDCFASNSFVSNNDGPLCSNVRTVSGATRAIKVGNNATAGARNTDPQAYNFGNHTLVFTEGQGGLTYWDISIGRLEGNSNWLVSNSFAVRGGWGFDQLTYADLHVGAFTPTREGVVWYVTDGTPGSAPLTGGGTGCLAVYQGGAWKGIATSSGVSDGDKGDITVSSGGAAWAIDNGAVSLAKMAGVATGTVFYRKTAGAGDPEVQTLATLKTDLGLSGTNTGDQTSVSGNAGTATALQTTRNFSISGGGITAAAITFNGTANVALSASVDAGHITLARMANLAANSFIGNNTGSAATPLALTGPQATALLDAFTSGAKGLAPASGGGTTNFLRADGTWAAPSGAGGQEYVDLGLRPIAHWQAVGAGTGITTIGEAALTVSGVINAGPAIATTNAYTATRLTEYGYLAAATTNAGGFRAAANKWFMSNNATRGGFNFMCRFGPSTGVAVTTNRCFVGMSNNTAAPTDVEPSSLLNMIGVGWDAADTNIQIMRNDATGTATKIDLGANFPVPTVDRTKIYELRLDVAPNSTTVNYRFVDVDNPAQAVSGTLTTDLPAVGTMLSPRGWMSVGGTSSVIGIALATMTLQG